MAPPSLAARIDIFGPPHAAADLIQQDMSSSMRDLPPAVDEAGQQLGEVVLQIDDVQLAGLCRSPNHAECFRNDTSLSRWCRPFPSRLLRTIRHSLVAQSAPREASNIIGRWGGGGSGSGCRPGMA
jgi:hypothetical protein